VTPSVIRRGGEVTPIRDGEPPHAEMALGLGYLRALEQAGGLPVVMAPLPLGAIDAMLEPLAGVCLTGGRDISPHTYGASLHPRLGALEPALDGFELAVARLADLRGVPILAIGRGMQLLNVVRGGTLHQHIPDMPAALEHRQSTGGDSTSHEISLDPASRLAGILGTNELAVNSFHHQCIDQLGDGLRAVARAPDGTIEGIEAVDHPFMVGVQWNAELLVAREPERSLFSKFVAACRGAVPVAEKSGT
jgi:putative glutamine amidotransferase